MIDPTPETQPVFLHIEVDPATGQPQVSGPIGDKPLCMKLIGAALIAIAEYRPKTSLIDVPRFAGVVRRHENGHGG